MRKLTNISLVVYLVCWLACPAFATDYYAGVAGSITADDCWFPQTDVVGSCDATAGTPVASATVLQAGNTIYLNGCAMTAAAGFTITKLSNADGDAAGNAVDGGTLTYTFPAGAQTIIVDTIETGANAICIELAGSTGGLTIGSAVAPVAITGGSGATRYAVRDQHSGAGVITTIYSSTITGGPHATGKGFVYNSAVVGGAVIYGTGVGGTAPGIENTHATGSLTVENCTGSATAVNIAGCRGAAAGGVTVTGNIINSDRASGADGYITYAPSSAQKKVSFLGGTDVYLSAGLGSDAGGTQIAAADTAAEVAVGTYFIKKDDGVYTQGTAAGGGGGGGAWGF